MLLNTLTIITLAIVIPTVLYVVLKRRQKHPQGHKGVVLTLTYNNFQQQVGSGITLVDFWASWCGPCKTMSPILAQVAAEVDGKASIAKVNIEEYQHLASKYAVKNIPTMLLFKNGKVVDRIVGVKSKDFLVNKIDWIKRK